MTVDLYQLSHAEMQKLANDGFAIGVTALAHFGELDAATAERLLNTYALIYAPRGFFGRAWDRLFKASDGKSAWRMQLVRLNTAETK